MTEKAALLAQRLIRNVERVDKQHDRRPPLYDSVGARLGTGTAADKLGASFDCVAPGMRSCPTIFTTLRRKCSSFWKAAVRCGWPEKCCRSSAGMSSSFRRARNTRTKSSTPPMRR